MTSATGLITSEISTQLISYRVDHSADVLDESVRKHEPVVLLKIGTLTYSTIYGLLDTEPILGVNPFKEC